MRREGPKLSSWLYGLVAYGRAGRDRCTRCGGPGGDARASEQLRASDTPSAARLSRLCAPCRREALLEDVRHASR